jgi:hypothetical protein
MEQKMTREDKKDDEDHGKNDMMYSGYGDRLHVLKKMKTSTLKSRRHHHTNGRMEK